ncbi:MAG: methanogenesis marker 17 protein [Methanotrichaceae archaeon]
MEMKPLEVFEIEVLNEECGGNKYKEIITDILQDLGLIRSIGKLYVYADMEIPFFAIFGLIRGKLPPLRVRDVGDLIQAEGGYQIVVEDEEHISDLLKVLWETYGRDKVEQPERVVLTIESSTSPEDLVVADLEVEFRRDLVDALIRIAPEGFRNRRNIMKKDHFFFLAAEETIDSGMIAEVEEKFRSMQNA